MLWLRLFALWLGHGTAAAGTVLAAFMGGLASGAWLAGRLADRLTAAAALRLYAALETVIAVSAVALPHALTLVQPWLRGAYADGTGGTGFAAVRVLVALLLLAVPTLAMGATYPVAVRCGAARRYTVPRWRGGPGISGRVYAANTAGAAIGVVLAAFVWLPSLGSDGTQWAGVALSIAVTAATLALARAAASEGDGVSPEQRGGAASPGLVPDSRGGEGTAAHTAVVPVIVVGLSGAVALVYEVVWTRILTMVLGPTAYAVGAMLLASIAGLAAGAWIASWRLARARRELDSWLGAGLVAAAAAAIGAMLMVDRLPLVVAEAASAPAAAFAAVLRLQVLSAIALQLPIAAALGLVFTVALGLVERSGAMAARRAAALYAVNTTGAIAGALGASFWLVPRFGLQTTLRLGVTLTALGGALALARLARGAGRWAGVATAAAVLAAAWVVPSWNQEWLANGAYRYAASLASVDLATGLEAGRLLYYREGAAGTVSVRELPGVRALAIDGKVDASNAEDMLTQKLLAHLPLLLHPAPADVLVIGLGSGVTAGAALVHPVRRVDVVEISREVVEASRFFVRENRRVLSDARTRLVVGDGRSHLQLGTRRYDVIVSEPSNPWMAGVATLFTREFFRSVRDRLAPGGVFCQWAHTYTIDGADLRSIVATFLETFPTGTAWLIGESDLLLVAVPGAADGVGAGLEAAWRRPGVADDLAAVEVTSPYAVMSAFVAGGADLRRYAGTAPVQRDGRLSLEYSAPRAVYGRFLGANVAALRNLAGTAARPGSVRRAEAGATAQERLGRAAMWLRADAASLAFDDLRALVRESGAVDASVEAFVRAATRTSRLDDALAALDALPATAVTPAVLAARSRLLSLAGRWELAINTARDAVLRSGGAPEPLLQLARVYADVGAGAALRQVLRVVGQSPPHRGVLMYSAARLAVLDGDSRRAAGLATALVAARPGDVDALLLAGTTRLAIADLPSARLAFERVLALAPRTTAALVGLGEVALAEGRLRDAVDRFADAAFVQPGARPPLDGLARAYDRLGEPRRAAAVRAAVAPRTADAGRPARP